MTITKQALQILRDNDFTESEKETITKFFDLYSSIAKENGRGKRKASQSSLTKYPFLNGLTIDQYCQKENISRQAFYGRLKKLNKGKKPC